MNNLETRKAQLREYIEARAKATQGEWKVDSEYGQDVFANGESRVLSSDPRWNYAPGKISCYNNLKFAALAANESALIAEQLLECIEALSGCSDGNCILRDRDFGQHTNGGCRCKRNIKFLLNKIAGEK